MERADENTSYFTLTPVEIQIVHNFRKQKLEKTAVSNIVNYLINQKDVTKLVKLAEMLPALEEVCLSQEFASYWEKVWAYCGRHPTWKEAQQNFASEYRPLMPQPGISSFNLFRGLHFFNRANELHLNGFGLADTQVQFFLNKALKYHCFEALKMYCNYQQQQLINRKADFEKSYQAIIATLKQNLIYHGTPVFLLLAYHEWKIAVWLQQEGANPQYPWHVPHLVKALSYVFAAEQIANESAAAVFNAYYGRGLSASNHEDWNTFEDWQNGILESCHEVGHENLKQNARTFSVQEVNFWRSAHSHSSELVSTANNLLSK